MSIRHHATSARPAAVSRCFGTGIANAAANDGASGAADDALLRAALMHFAHHGLGAADLARDNAERAFFADDRIEYKRWMGICRLLDARMARAVAARHPDIAPELREA